jgi:hypothetical protein
MMLMTAKKYILTLPLRDLNQPSEVYEITNNGFGTFVYSKLELEYTFGLLF